MTTNVWSTLAQTSSGAVHEVDPISRIEGHLGVKVVTDSTGKILDANAHGNLWRGFENFLLGRDINDAITFVQRICGVCPVPHGMTSTYACDTVLGYSRGHITFKAANGYGVPEKAVLIRNLVLGAEFLMSSITHFYHLAAPSYIQGPAIPPWTPYFDNNQYPLALRSSHSSMSSGGVQTVVPNVNPAHTSAGAKAWDAIIYSYVKALKIRRMTFEAGALFAGRMPMTSCLVAGGVTNDGTEDLTARALKFGAIIKDVADFIVSEYIPIVMALSALMPGYDNTNNSGSGYGAGLGRFLAWGGFPQLDDTLALPGGVFEATGSRATAGTHAGSETVTNFRVLNKNEVYSYFVSGGPYSVPTNLTEDIVNSRYKLSAVDAAAGITGSVHYPGDVARTNPARTSGYTYMKAPRWAGHACEVGPLARLAVAGLYPVGNEYLRDVVPGYGSYLTIAGDFDFGVIESTIVAGLINDSLAATVSGYIYNCKGGLSTMDRLRARALESFVLVQKMIGPAAKPSDGHIVFSTSGGWVGELLARTGSTLKDTGGSTWAARPGRTTTFNPYGVNQGWGGTEAPRGALMHQTTIKGGKIQKYQCIVPTTWNGSPKDSSGANGAIEAAVIGAPFMAGLQTTNNFTKQNGTTASTVVAGGVEVLRIAQSFDPCIACAIH